MAGAARVQFEAAATATTTTTTASVVAAAVAAADDEILTWAPRFMFGSPPRLAKRQAGQEGRCGPGESPCRAVNATNACCPNDNYCYINPAGLPSCCAFGSRCDDPCPVESYRCTVSSRTRCCPRACPAPSAFQCAESLGGRCCSVGSVCLPSNRCMSTVNPATVNTVTASPTGCTGGLSSCPAEAGGGCCSSGWACAVMSSGLSCVANNGASTTNRPGGNVASITNAAGLPSPTTAVDDDDGGLSDGATAGIAVGAVILGLTLISLIIWFIIKRRRQRRTRPTTAETSALSPAVGGGGMSQVPSPGAGSTGPDYFAPDALPGPYTGGAAGDAGDASGLTTHMPSHRAVPLTPQDPDDIIAPVEIMPSDAVSQRQEPPAAGGAEVAGPRARLERKDTGFETIEGRVELP